MSAGAQRAGPDLRAAPRLERTRTPTSSRSARSRRSCTTGASCSAGSSCSSCCDRRDLRAVPEDRRARRRAGALRRRHLVLGRHRGRLQRGRVRRLRGALPRRARRGGRLDERAPAARLARLVPDHDGRAGRHADLLGRRAPAASCSPTGRCARPGMPRRRSACRMVAFLALMYGGLPGRARDLRDPAADRRAAGRRPVRRHVVPAAVAGGVMAVFALMALIPQDVERRHRVLRRRLPAQALPRAAGHRARPPLATGVRTAIAYVRHPQRRRARGRRRGRLLGGQHRRALGELRGVRRQRAVRRARAGLLRGHGGQPDPVARRRRRARWTRA